MPVPAPEVGAVSDCTSAGALAQNFKVGTNSTDTVKIGDYVALEFGFDLNKEVRRRPRPAILAIAEPWMCIHGLPVHLDALHPMRAGDVG